MNLAKLNLAVLVFVSCQAGHAQDAAANFNEQQVKSAVEEAAVYQVCPNQTLLEIAEIEVGDCRSHIAKFSAICWHLIDPLVSNYELEQGEKGKKRFINFLGVYASCLKAELLREIVESSRESDTP